MTNGQNTILGIHSGALGDVVLFARLLGELGGPVTLVAGGEKANLLAGLGAVDRAVNFDEMPMHEVFSDTPLERCRLGKLLGRHNRLISCFATDNAAAEARLAALCGLADAAMLPIRPPANWDGHLLDLWRDMLGVTATTRLPHDCGSFDVPHAPWVVPPAWRCRALKMLSAQGVDTDGPVLVIHPGAGGRHKCWPLERFIELARLVEGIDGARVVFILGPVECERWSQRQIVAIGAEFAMVREPTMETMAGVIAVAAGLVGNDSGPAHLAAAVGRPTVALFGPTRAEQFSPDGAATVTISRESMSKIQVGDVFEAIKTSARLPGRQQTG